jgi:hypothetical protein
LDHCLSGLRAEEQVHNSQGAADLTMGASAGSAVLGANDTRRSLGRRRSATLTRCRSSLSGQVAEQMTANDATIE